MEQNETNKSFFSRAKNLGNAFSMNIINHRPKSRSNSLSNIVVNSASLFVDEKEKKGKDVDFTGITPHQVW